MNVFCDTSVLVAASLETHSRHIPCRDLLQRISRGDDVAYCSTHSLAETFSVLTRMPTTPKLQPIDVLAILERNIFPHFVSIPLHARDYVEAIRALVTVGVGGGRIYGTLHLQAASKLVLDRIYTLNVSEWTGLAPNLAPLISGPPAEST